MPSKVKLLNAFKEGESWEGLSNGTAEKLSSKRKGKGACLTMKVAICLFALVALAVAAPQRDGGALTDEAIRQAQSQQLIPQDAQIQGVQQGIQVAALESVPGSQRVDLFQLLGDQVPREVITNLQSQVDQVGQV
uniref:Uncharacterized protein n=1 Tax=Anopheles melas TaxID=34690 RepID=A0A182TUW4_9DIPT